MKCLLSYILLFMTLTSMAHATRLKDMASVKGVRNNQLVGYGLVVGLDGTGDGSKAPFTSQAMINMLEQMGVHINPADLKTKNVAGVLITATLPPFIKIGQTIDVTVSSLGDAKSLAGGTLVASPLKGLDNKIYGIAQGPVTIGGFALKGAGANQNVQKNHLAVARIPDGATVEREVPISLRSKDTLTIQLNSPDFTTMGRVVEAANRLLAGSYATAQDGATVTIVVPEDFKQNQVGLLAALENLEVTPDSKAKIIIDERTGTVVMGADVQINEVAVAHGNLSVQISSTPNQAVGDKLMQLPNSVTLGEVVKGLNAVGVTTRDLIAIFQSMKASGAIQAELEII